MGKLIKTTLKFLAVRKVSTNLSNVYILLLDFKPVIYEVAHASMFPGDASA